MQDLSGKKGPTACIVVNYDPWGTSGGLGDDTGAGSIPNPTGGLVVNYDPMGLPATSAMTPAKASSASQSQPEESSSIS
jgi:hypothetical protein